jgi:hypothetical protein
MASIRQGLGYRLAWSLLAAFLSLSSLMAAIVGVGWVHFITALGWAAFAVVWFLKPIVGSSVQIGSPQLRAVLLYSAICLLVIGLFAGRVLA